MKMLNLKLHLFCFSSKVDSGIFYTCSVMLKNETLTVKLKSDSKKAYTCTLERFRN